MSKTTWRAPNVKRLLFVAGALQKRRQNLKSNGTRAFNHISPICIKAAALSAVVVDLPGIAVVGLHPSKLFVLSV